MFYRKKKTVDEIIHEVTHQVIHEELQQWKDSLKDEEFARLDEKFAKLYERIAITENNLNYYGMIHSIQEEFKYANLELFMNSPLEGRNILVAGFYGACNLGDELMLQTLLEYLIEGNYGNITVLLCDNLHYNYFDFPGVRFIHYPQNKFDFNIIAQQYDALIWGGGAIIDDVRYEGKAKSDIFELGNMLIELSKRFLAFGKTCIALGLSSNKELTNDKYINDLKDVIHRCAFFSVRDSYTKNVLINIGVKNEKIAFLNDIVFAGKSLEKELANGKRKVRASNKMVIGIAFICLEETQKVLEEVITSIHNVGNSEYKGNYEIRCIPFYDYNGNDYNFYVRTIEKMNESGINIVVCDYVNTFSGILEELRKVDFMVNMRYHAMLLSMVLRIPSLNICLDSHEHYYNKVKFLAELGKYEESVVMMSSIKEEHLKEIIEHTLLGRKEPQINARVLPETREKLEKILRNSLMEE